MRHALIAVVMTFVLAFVTVFAANASGPEPAPEACIINVLGVKVCGTLLGEPLTNIVEVTVPGPTITVPPVTVTDVVTVRPDPIRLTETIRPDPVRLTETVTIGPQPQATATATATVTEKTTVKEPSSGATGNVPAPTVTETVRPNGKPVPTVTETATVSVTETATGQPQPESGTVVPSDSQDEDFFRYDLDLGDDSVSAGEAGVGILGALVILALILGGMAYGFRRGRASFESEETNFLRNLLDRNKIS